MGACLVLIFSLRLAMLINSPFTAMAFSEIILTESLPNLGSEADVVRVRRGYARNFLIPRGLAIPATKASVKQIEALKAKRAEREARELTAAEELARKISKLELVFTLETGQAGKAFGSVTAKDITDKLSAQLQGVELPKHAVVLDRSIKDTGEHEVSVRLHPDVSAKVRVLVKSASTESNQDSSSESTSPRKNRKTKA